MPLGQEAIYIYDYTFEMESPFSRVIFQDLYQDLSMFGPRWDGQGGGWQ